MEKIPENKENKAPKRKSSREVRVSSSGRNITTPKHLQSSSDEQPPVKKGMYSKNLKAEIERLKSYAAVIKKQEGTKKIGNGTKDSEDNKDSENTDVYSTRRSSDPIDPSSLDALNSVEVKTKNHSLPKTKNTKFFQPSGKAAAILKNITAKDVDDSNNRPSAIAHSKIPAPLIKKTKKTSENMPLTTPIMRSPPSPKDDTIQSQSDEVFGETVPINFQKIVEDRLEKIEKSNETLIEQNKEILKILSNQHSIAGEKVSKTLYERLKGYPITTIEQFKELESDTNKEARRKIYDYLLCLGGNALRGFLLTSLQIIMTDDLVCRFTWNGDAKTEKFGDTKVSNVLYQAAKNCPLFQGPYNKNLFKTEMLQVLRTTKQRFRNSKKKEVTTKENRTKETDGREHSEGTAEGIQRKISQLEEMLEGNSDADNEGDDLSSNSLDDDQDIENFEG